MDLDILVPPSIRNQVRYLWGRKGSAGLFVVTPTGETSRDLNIPEHWRSLDQCYPEFAASRDSEAVLVYVSERPLKMIRLHRCLNPNNARLKNWAIDYLRILNSWPIEIPGSDLITVVMDLEHPDLDCGQVSIRTSKFLIFKPNRFTSLPPEPSTNPANIERVLSKERVRQKTERWRRPSIAYN